MRRLPRRSVASSPAGPSCPGTRLEACAPVCASPSPAMQLDPAVTPAWPPTDAAAAAEAGPSLTDLDSPRKDQHPEQPWRKGPEDFAFGKVLGEGSFAIVVLARDLATSKDYAIKILEKKQIIREKKAQYVTSERDVMSRLDHPFFVKLYFTFQDEEKLYFGLSYAKNGDLQRYVQKLGPLAEPCAQFYSAEIVSALEYLHGQEIIHRDLKPENILLNAEMHIQITDFGSAKILAPCSKQARANSFVGTAHYVSPELLMEQSACKSSDLWALGCVVYYLVAGLSPFEARNEYLIFQKIIKLAYYFPEQFFPKAKDLVGKLLVSDSTNRLGCEEMGSYAALKAHPFFENISWDDLHLQIPPQVPGSFLSTSEDENDFGNDDIFQSLASSSSSSHSFAAVQPRLLQRPTAPVEGYIHELEENSLELDLEFSEEEKKLLLQKQASGNPWHQFVNNHLILKMGPVDKRKGLFARRRQLLLTEGPHLYYVDPISKVLKGEIPWSAQLWAEAKNFKTFYVHTPNRTYHLIDPNGNAHKWCQKIQEVCQRRCQDHPQAAV
ncbi:3-phosphoinositide-dependent protein kinase 1-like [Trichosurus vulpecula]|uniref:3-phosphoinositide-dependent protein kinase 1-like n=1 Tax=Trichosurus vulpecula TaxID=9337 RepID=UPI00186AFB6F|nr:3-phosphoinositide-dependent protein kinase 1-like [Trichosurus vulpecula]